MRRASFLAAYILCVLASRPIYAASEVLSGASPLAARASLDFRLTVPRVMQMRLLGHPASLDITAEDIARGIVTVTGPRVDLVVNDRLGFVLRAELVNAVFSAAKIVGLPSQLVATAGGATARIASMVGRARPQPLDVRYELQLAPGAQPGRYAWPVALTLQEP